MKSITCAHKLMVSQLNLLHGTKKRTEKMTKRTTSAQQLLTWVTVWLQQTVAERKLGTCPFFGGDLGPI